MKFVSVEYQHRVVPGLWLPEGVLDLEQAAQRAGEDAPMSSVLEIIRGGKGELDGGAAPGRAPAAGKDGATEARRGETAGADSRSGTQCLLCGRNYVDHVKEGASARGRCEVAGSAAILHQGDAHGDWARRRRATGSGLRTDLDYEVELAVIIGQRRARYRMRSRLLTMCSATRWPNDVTRARPAAPPRSMVQGQIARHYVSVWAVDHRPRGDRRS